LTGKFNNLKLAVKINIMAIPPGIWVLGGVGVAALGVRLGMEYREAKKYIPGPIRKLGIDPKDVSFFTYLYGIDIPESSLLYGSSYHGDQELQWEIDYANAKYFGAPEGRDPEKFVEILLKNLTRDEILNLIKNKERGKYKYLLPSDGISDIQPSSSVQG
jgi:hypothetical protein